MTAVPAQVAGVQRIAVAVPPTAFGGYNVDLLAACRELNIHEVYRMGGAQGVAALAYGVEGIERVDKIVAIHDVGRVINALSTKRPVSVSMKQGAKTQ